MPSGSDNNNPITVTNVLNNEYVFAIIAILAFAYGQRAALKPPNWLMNLFSNNIFRVFYLALLLIVRFESRPTIAIIMALVFVYVLQYIYVKETKEAFQDIVNSRKID